MTFLCADAARLPFADDTFDMVFTSPPYLDCRTYGIAGQRKCQAWIDWMLGVVSECVRVTRGLVLVNCAGVTRDWNYQPGPEGLLYEWWKRGGRAWRPAFWHRVGIPGSEKYHSDQAKVNAEFITLARKAFDVMMRRNWHPHRALISGWYAAEQHSVHTAVLPAIICDDPFTALVEADDWYKANVEAKS